MKYIRPTPFLTVFLFLGVMLACEPEKNEFIALDHLTFTNSYYKNAVKISYYVLMTNPNAKDEKLKSMIVQYVKNRLRNDQSLTKAEVTSLNFVFYKKTGNTSYFIKHKENSGGLSSQEIAHYKDDYIANYYVSKCDGGGTEKIYLHDLPEEMIYSDCK